MFVQREPVLMKELGRVQHPTRVFTFEPQIWFPRNWVVERHQYGETTVIPTVLVDSPYSLPTAWAHQPDEVSTAFISQHKSVHVIKEGTKIYIVLMCLTTADTTGLTFNQRMICFS